MGPALLFLASRTGLEPAAGWVRADVFHHLLTTLCHNKVGYLSGADHFLAFEGDIPVQRL